MNLNDYGSFTVRNQADIDRVQSILSNGKWNEIFGNQYQGVVLKGENECVQLDFNKDREDRTVSPDAVTVTYWNMNKEKE